MVRSLFEFSGFAPWSIPGHGVRGLALSGLCLGLVACGSPRYAGPDFRPAPVISSEKKQYHSGTLKPYQVRGIWYYPTVPEQFQQVGIASWYGPGFHGKSTAMGEAFNTFDLTAAHKTLPLPSLVEVYNLDNGKKLVVRVNDRGPFVDGRIIDLSKTAADQLGVMRTGTARVQLTWLGPADGSKEFKIRSELARADLGRRPKDVTAQPNPVQEPTAEDKSPRLVQNAPTKDLVDATAGAQSDLFHVQAAAFSDRNRAKDALTLLGQDGIIQPIDRNGRTLYRVLVGPFDAAAAEKARAKAMIQGFLDAKITKFSQGPSSANLPLVQSLLYPDPAPTGPDPDTPPNLMTADPSLGDPAPKEAVKSTTTPQPG